MKFKYNLSDSTKLEVGFYFKSSNQTVTNAIIDWGDSTTASNVIADGSYIHIYSGTNIYTITISLPSATTTIIHFGKNPLSSVALKGIEFLEEVEKEVLDSFYSTPSLLSFNGIFYGASKLTIVPNSIPTSIKYIDSAFELCSIFNQNINSWNVSNILTMNNTFNNASNFNQPLNSWDVSNVILMTGIFDGCTNFNQELNNWNVGNVTYMHNMFHNAINFNKPLNNWNVSNVTNMDGMFDGCTNFDQNLNNWNVSKVTDMVAMFRDTNNFNQNLNNWNVSQVTNMTEMFHNAINFNGNISNWNVSKVMLMGQMFQNAIKFQQDISNWNVSQVTMMTFMFENVKLPCPIYTNILKKWSQLSLQNGVFFDGGLSMYHSSATPYKNIMTTTYTWYITDGGIDNICCLTRDTQILTPHGYINIEKLEVGNIVITNNHKLVKIKSIYKKETITNNKTYPYIIPVNSLGKDIPSKPIKLSGGHLIKYNDKWILPSENFKQDKSVKSIEYYHIELENYITDNLIINGGLVLESYGKLTNDNLNERKNRLNNLIKIKKIKIY